MAEKKRLEFYDPLYETITFERGLPARHGFLRHPEDPLNPAELVKTADFARLAFLRQAGLAWLVFPSAGHTRFAHSIGCWWLGRIAETHIRVKGALSTVGPTNEVYSLQKWLEATNLREEFYLSLLFHDLGHGPFSHVLESNADFIAGLIDAGLPEGETNHDYRGASLIDGEGPLAAAWAEIAARRYGREVRTLAETIKVLVHSRGGGKICIPSILYLITSNPRYLVQCRCNHQSYLKVLHGLVGGILNLDRLDHYARDSYFSGVRQVAINIRGFLNSLSISYEGEQNENILFSLTHDGASHAASLLFGKRQIVSTIFRNQDTLSFQAMAGWALSRFLQDIDDHKMRAAVCLEIAMMEDGHLLERIGGSRVASCKYLIQRLRSLNPYTLAGRWSNEFNLTSMNHNQMRNNLRAFEPSRSSVEEPELILSFDDGFWTRSRQEPADWLDSSSLILEETGQCLTLHPEYKDSFIHLQSQSRRKHLWVFVKDPARREWAIEVISRIFGGKGPSVL